jgi:hypothetical protein
MSSSISRVFNMIISSMDVPHRLEPPVGLIVADKVHPIERHSGHWDGMGNLKETAILLRHNTIRHFT